MPKGRCTTRYQERVKKARNAEASRKCYHNKSAEERSNRNAKQKDKARNSKKIDVDRVDHLRDYATTLKRQSKAGRKRIKALWSDLSELAEKYALMADEPTVDASQAEAATAAFERAQKHPECFRQLTNESLEDFNELWQVVQKPLTKINYRGETRKRSATQRQLLPDQVQLFITLLFLRQYPTYAMLSFALGGLSPLSLHHYICRVLVALSDLDVMQISWPTDAEMTEHVKKPANWPYPDKKHIVAATDGTEIRVARPTKNAIGNKHYSAKKKQYALNVLLVVLLSGSIIFCSAPLDMMNDQAFFNHTNIRKRFENKPWGLIADSGFTLNGADAVKNSCEIKGMTPNKQPRGRKKAKKASEKQEKAVTKVQKQTEKLQAEKGKVTKKRKKDEPNLVSEEVLEVGVVPASMRASGVGLTDSALQEATNMLAEKSPFEEDQSWTCSKGWLYRWKEAHGVTSRVAQGEKRSADVAAALLGVPELNLQMLGFDDAPSKHG